MTDERPSALEMLKLEPDQFMVEVSRAISEKPWLHHSKYGPIYPFDCPPPEGEDRDGEDDVCIYCGEHPIWKMLSEIGSCSVPPTLTDPPEVIAFRLRDEAVNTVGELAIDVSVGKVFNVNPIQDMLAHYAYRASPYEQIAVCFVALGKWRIEG